ncbi:Heat shock protein 14 [Merluccius polli]|uniref:Heat shock protein 14 n=1 Tax=Merluccius polli TaxID=89951 RepID=A0AA47P824_MERPO|nr:Heat shock protein 14 [Merluccius polli]
MAAIGVHFGTRDGRADVIANDAGDRVTPSVVAYRDTEQIVGIAAKQGRVRNAANTVVKVKQLLGRTAGDPETDAHKAESKCPVSIPFYVYGLMAVVFTLRLTDAPFAQVVSKGEKLYYEITAGEQSKLVTPDAVAKLVLEKMRETAQSALGSDVTDAVITVPFEFTQAQKTALREAAEAAGFNVLRLIHEPSCSPVGLQHRAGVPLWQEPCAGVQAGWHVSERHGAAGERRHVPGAGHAHGPQHRRGEHHRCPGTAPCCEFKRSFKQDVSNNARAMMKLMNGADLAKHSLSSLGSANCFVDSLHDGMDFDCNISRARFELLCSSLFNKSIQPIKTLLERVGLSTEDINKVVLCGGSARIPRLQQLIREMFPDVEQLCSTPPDEVIAMGAALEAGLLAGKDGPSPDDESVTVDACAADIMVKELDESGAEVFNVLLPAGTPLPARRHHTLLGPGQLSSLCLELYQRLTQQPQKLARIVLRDLEPKEDNHDIDTVLTMKRDGSLHVSCVDQSSGRSEVVTIAAAS